MDGEKNKLKVNRKYLIKDKNNFYAEIKNEAPVTSAPAAPAVEDPADDLPF